MKLIGEDRIAASRQQVWDALNDPEVLRLCIPGCQALERESAERMNATVAIKVGPIGARFTGVVTLSDLDPPNGYTITGEGAGGAAGFAKGGAAISLTDDDGVTVLTYEVNAQVGGRLAQLGGAVIDATAKQLARAFFKRFGEIVLQPGLGAPVVDAAVAQTAATSPARSADDGAGASRSGDRSLIWMAMVVAAALAGFLIGRAQGGNPVANTAPLLIGLFAIAAAVAGFTLGRRRAVPRLSGREERQ